ncbi:MAG: sugar MFS transporter [Melioribacteraceae bacterium]|nr:sugar MFS transporter [Melioribacteraceae bacterium]
MASTTTSSTNIKANNNGQNYTFALTVLTSLFFMWGFITCLNDILIPHLKAVFTLNYTQVMMIQFSFFTAYAIVSLPSGMLVEKIGYKNGIVIGLITTGIGSLLFYPAAAYQSYIMFLGALFILASGITLLQVAANPYVAILGKPETASSRLNLTQAFNSLGTTIAPLFGSMLILSVAVKTAEELKSMTPDEVTAYKLAEASAVQTPYLLIAAVLFVIAAVFAIIKLPKIEASEVASSDGNGSFDHHHDSAWGYRHLVLGAVAIFVYVGGEVSIGSFLVNYFGQPNIAGLKEAEAGKLVSFYWGGAMVGRFLGSYLQTIIKPNKYLAFNAFVAASLVVVSMLTNGQVAMWSILAVGFFNSIMFPTIFTLAINGLGKHTGQGSGILCTAIVGGALIPVLQGYFADNIGIQHAFFIPVLCYMYIAYYGLKGYKPTFAQ